MNKQPLVSVLICTYNAGDFINQTMISVLKQSYKNLEILILDNHSQDKTIDLIKMLQKKDKRIKLYVSNKNLGAYPGLNFLLRQAKGSYIAINDHDDIWYQDKLKEQIDFLEKNKKFVGCGSAIVNFYQKYNKYLLRQQPQKANVAWHTSFVYRNFGKYYDTSLKVGNDFYFMKNILCHGKKIIYNLNKPYVLRQIRSNKSNLSSQWINFKNLIDILRIELNFIDKISLIYRLIIPYDVADFLLLNCFMSKNILTKSIMQRDKILNYFLLITSSKST